MKNKIKEQRAFAEVEYAFGEKVYFDNENNVIKIELDDRPLYKKILSEIFRRNFDVSRM